ncbi:hypothetical protein HYU45_01280 [Candidatus Daviesbacteria bacterium]|nr:hypothetical protein [Candidatus Daviesbacteria bacterium]
MNKLLDFWAPWCIDPETPVLTENGYIKALQVKIGQRLIAIDPKTKKQSIKKVQKVRIFKDASSKKIILETGRELVGDVNHLVLTQEGFKKLEELTVGAKILVDPVVKVDQFNESIALARLLGFVVTDGYLYEDLKHHIHETHFFVGTEQDAKDIKNDLECLGFHKLEIKIRSNKRVIDGREFIINTYRCRNFEKALFELLKSKGAPVGRKKNQAYFVPEWIMDGDVSVKSAFLSGWLGGDGCKIDYYIKHAGASSHNAGFKVNAIEFHKEKEFEREGILYAKQLGLLLEQLGVEVRDISSSDDEDGVIISLRVATDYQSLFNLASIGYAYARSKNVSIPFIREFLQYRLFERNRYIQAKQIALQQLALGVSSNQIAESLQIPVGTIVSWNYANRDTQVVYPAKGGEALFIKWLEQRQQENLLWERVLSIEEADNRDVIGITVGDPHTIITNGMVSHNCGPCHVMAPVLEELEKELSGKVEIEKINVDDNQAKASEHGVMSIPTYIILKDGKEVARKIGVTAKADLLKLLQS